MAKIAKKKLYSHVTIDKGYVYNNRTRFFFLCLNCLGPDYRLWTSHPRYKDVALLAHITIYKLPESTFNPSPRTGLSHQIEFLIGAKTYLKKINKHRCYEEATTSGLEAGVVTPAQVRSWR